MRTVPLHRLPALISAFEAKRGVDLLSADEMTQLEAFSQTSEMSVSVRDLVSMLQTMGALGSPVKQRAPLVDLDQDPGSAAATLGGSASMDMLDSDQYTSRAAGRSTLKQEANFSGDEVQEGQRGGMSQINTGSEDSTQTPYLGATQGQAGAKTVGCIYSSAR